MQGRACRHIPIGVFFPDHGERFDNAAMVCASCPVLKLCKQYFGLSDSEGYIAGLTPTQRKALRRKVS